MEQSKKQKYFLSYSHEEKNKPKIEKIQEVMKEWGKAINLSEREDKSKFTDETIWNYLHKRIADSSLTILFYSFDLHSFNREKIEYVKDNFLASGWIYNEISASLRDWKNNRRNSLVCVIDEKLENMLFNSDKIKTNDLPEILKENNEYIVFAKYSEFVNNNYYLINSIYKANFLNAREHLMKEGKVKYNLHLSKK
ncbi:hypothetical protein MCSF7_02888 [Mycoplasmopsis columbina SF7]|uniref:TIR domain-containing protein n=1 Tax=Mycoplasmopsis columbina SF7 TaxID=1037410 RepID=F9UJB9_9BACT|nr:TIR domain-containing protein [Mycoplasmopsis columbina]EGV00462.1 hypothetical protein MCSF7_02888 [Mycoplasmopsis columbina SF7]